MNLSMSIHSGFCCQTEVPLLLDKHTLAPKSEHKTGAKKKTAEAASTVNPSPTSTSDASDKWAVLDLNQ